MRLETLTMPPITLPCSGCPACMTCGMITKLCIIEFKLTFHMQPMAQLAGNTCTFQNAQPWWDAGMLHMLHRLCVCESLFKPWLTHSVDQTLPMPELDITEATCSIEHDKVHQNNPACHKDMPYHQRIRAFFERWPGCKVGMNTCTVVIRCILCVMFVHVTSMLSLLTGANCQAPAKQWWGQHSCALACDMFYCRKMTSCTDRTPCPRTMTPHMPPQRPSHAHIHSCFFYIYIYICIFISVSLLLIFIYACDWEADLPARQANLRKQLAKEAKEVG